jgi:hypothetical protein
MSVASSALVMVVILVGLIAVHVSLNWWSIQIPTPAPDHVPAPLTPPKIAVSSDA